MGRTGHRTHRARPTRALLLTAALATGLAAATVRSSTPALGAEPELATFAPFLQEKLGPLVDHQDEGHYHKASAGYFELIEAGLPRRDSALVRQRLAQCLEAIGFHFAAAHVYFEAVKLASGLPEHRALMKAWIDHAFSLPGRPLYAMGAIVDLPASDDPLDLESLRYLRGLVAFRGGDDGGALVAFEDIEEDPALAARAHFLLGVLYARQGLSELAEAEMQGVVSRIQALPPDAGLGEVLAQAQLDLGRLAYSRGDLARARASYTAAAESAADRDEAHRELAWALLRADQPKEAWELAAPLVDRPIWPADARLLLALAYQRTGERRLSRDMVDAFRGEIKAHQAVLGKWIDRYPRKEAEAAAVAFLGLEAELTADGQPPAAEAPNVPPPLPAGLKARLEQDWRLRGAAEEVRAARAELRFLDKQMEWWRDRSVGRTLPSVIEERIQRTLRQAGVFILDSLDKELASLDRMAVEALLLKKERDGDLGPLADWKGDALPGWPPPSVEAPAEGED